MSNFELIVQNTTTLEDFICAVQDDALEAEGCSLYLRLPPQGEDPDSPAKDSDLPAIDWKEWLEQEAEDEAILLPHNKSIVRWKKRGEDE